MKEQRLYHRDQLNDSKDLSMVIIPFEKLERVDISVKAVDMCDGGIGIATDRVLDPGFVVIRNGDEEHRNGVLLWSRELENKTYRSGIQYIPLLLRHDHAVDKKTAGSSRSVIVDQETERRHRLATAVFMHTTRGIMVTDAGGIVLSVNDAFVKITGFSAAETIGKTEQLFTSGERDDFYHAQVRKALQEKGMWSGIYWSRRKNGEIYPQEITINAIRNDDGQVMQYCSIFSDITEQYHQEERLRLLSTTDSLTGLSNRRVFDESFETEWRRAKRSGYALTVIMIDIDNFKKYNDTYGHVEGDECLKKVSDALKSRITRAGDLVARYGGEEFTVLLPMVKESEGAKIAEEIKARVEALRIPHSKNGPSGIVTISMGVASVVPRIELTPRDLLTTSDRALYRAKELGRNRVCCASELQAGSFR